MSERRWNKAAREIEETQILVAYLLAHDLDFDNLDNFTDKAVRAAKDWMGYDRARVSR